MHSSVFPAVFYNITFQFEYFTYFFQISFYPPVFPLFHPLLPSSPPSPYPPQVFTFATQATGQGSHAAIFLSAVPWKRQSLLTLYSCLPSCGPVSASSYHRTTPHGTLWLGEIKCLQGISAGSTCEGLTGGSWLPWPTG